MATTQQLRSRDYQTQDEQVESIVRAIALLDNDQLDILYERLGSLEDEALAEAYPN